MPFETEKKLLDIIDRNKNCKTEVEVAAIKYAIDEMYGLDPAYVSFDLFACLRQCVENYNKPEHDEIRILVAYALRQLDPKGERMASTDILSLLLTDSSEEVCVKAITLARQWRYFYKPTAVVLKAFNTHLASKILHIDASWAVADFHPLEVLQIMQYRLIDPIKRIPFSQFIDKFSEQQIDLIAEMLENLEKQSELNKKLQWEIRKLASAEIPAGFKPRDRSIRVSKLSRSYPLVVLLEGTDDRYPLNTRIGCMLGIEKFSLSVFQLIKKNFSSNNTDKPSLTQYLSKPGAEQFIDHQKISRPMSKM